MVPVPSINSQEWWRTRVVPALLGERQGGPWLHWPESPADLMSSRPKRDPVSKKADDVSEDDT